MLIDAAEGLEAPKHGIAWKEYAELVQDYSGQLLSLLQEKVSSDRQRTYGFEYEFLPRQPIAAAQVRQLKEFLSDREVKGKLAASSMRHVTFEPGGQIEYCSPPMLAGDRSALQETLAWIAETNAAIFSQFGIEYLAVGYLPGRAEVPLSVTSKRYRHLQARLQICGARGKEMMKGTASVHLHLSLQSIEEMLPLFRKLAAAASDQEFAMSPERRDIWNHTDPSRCLLPSELLRAKDSEELVAALVRLALQAEDIYTGIPFWQTRSRSWSFAAFLEHFTTMYTDVRLNLKGPTLELRTLDSLSLPCFEQKWRKFVKLFADGSSPA